MLENFHHFLETLYESQQQDVRRYVARFAAEVELDEAVRVVRDFVLGMPAVLTCLTDVVLHQDSPIMGRIMAGSVSAYLFRPRDFIPEDEYGFYGFVDDAYVVTYALQVVMGHLESSVMSEVVAPQREQIDHQIALMERAERFMPEEVVFMLKSFLQRLLDDARIISGQVDLWMPLP